MKTPRLAAAGLLALALLVRLPGYALGGRGSLPDVVDAPFFLEKPLPETDPVDPAQWFRDAVFIGDSRTEELRGQGDIAGGLWLTSDGCNVRTVRTQADFTVEGRAVTLAQALEGERRNKVYLMLGVNEASWMGEEEFVREYAGLIRDIKQLLPGAQIYVQTLIPMTISRSTARAPDNALLARRSALIRQVAKEARVYLADVEAALAGTEYNGALPKELSTDGFHLNEEGNRLWLRFLCTHAVRT